jgi:hypothetical protein
MDGLLIHLLKTWQPPNCLQQGSQFNLSKGLGMDNIAEVQSEGKRISAGRKRSSTCGTWRVIPGAMWDRGHVLIFYRGWNLAVINASQHAQREAGA